MPLLIIDNPGARKLLPTAAEDLLEIVDATLRTAVFFSQSRQRLAALTTVRVLAAALGRCELARAAR